MGYGNRFSDDYAEEQRFLEDPERIKAFLSDLNVSRPAEDVLEPEEVDEDVEVVATYQLEHPYRGDDYSKALLHDEDVVASVEVAADVSDTQGFDYRFRGSVKNSAYDIFNPPEPSVGDPETGPEPGNVDASDTATETGKATD